MAVALGLLLVLQMQWERPQQEALEAQGLQQQQEVVVVVYSMLMLVMETQQVVEEEIQVVSQHG
jgi:hypothetical protein